MKGIEKALAGAALLAARIRERGNHSARLMLATAACLGLVGCGPYINTKQMIEAVKGCEAAGLRPLVVVNNFTGGTLEVACLPK